MDIMDGCLFYHGNFWNNFIYPFLDYNRKKLLDIFGKKNEAILF